MRVHRFERRSAALRATAVALVAGATMIGDALEGGAFARTTESTRRMAARLKQIHEAADPRFNEYMNAERAALLERVPMDGLSSEERLVILRMLSTDLVNSNRVEDSIERLAEEERLMKGLGVEPGSVAWVDLRVRESVAHLRRAENENCVLHHNPRSCLFPVKGTGVHQRRQGSTAAASILTEILERQPGNLQARWLLNIAYMTLGTWPQEVPARWLLPPDLFASEHELPAFKDIASGVGLDVDDNAGGSIVDDFDGDGYLDVMVSAMGFESQIRLFHNNADGTFAETTDEAGLTGEVGGLNIVSTDYDNDGRLDVLVLRGGWMGKGGNYPNSLLHNEGSGRFSDVTERAGLLSFHPTQAAVWFDVDSDGWLDLFIGNESTKQANHPSEFYRNNRDGTFTECSRQAGLEVNGYIKGVTSGDYNDDGRPDLYLSWFGEPNRLYRNDGPAAPFAAPDACSWKFTEVAKQAGVSEPIWSFPTWFFDYDNDGHEDLFASGFLFKDAGDVAADVLGLNPPAERPRLYRNRGDGTFENVTKAAHLDHVLMAMGSNYGDLDNDGWLDFYLGTGNPNLGTLIPNRMFRNAEGRFFQDVTTAGGFGHLQKGHGVSFADIDNDGDQDVYEVIGGAYPADHFRNALFENPGGGGHWIALKLEGVASNRPAIGARIKVIVQTPDGERSIYRTVRSGGSFGCSPLRQEIGLGDATQVARVEIRWPAGGTQAIEKLDLDRRYLVREGKPRPQPILLSKLRLGEEPQTPTAPKAATKDGVAVSPAGSRGL